MTVGYEHFVICNHSNKINFNLGDSDNSIFQINLDLIKLFIFINKKLWFCHTQQSSDLLNENKGIKVFHLKSLYYTQMKFFLY